MSRLIEAYLAQTELEKAAHLAEAVDLDGLPERYLAEVEHPAEAYERADVLLADVDGEPAGVAVLQHRTATHEIKRVWVDPRARGRRVGSALIDALVGQRDKPVRLTVWSWRDEAMRLYQSRGFVPVASWENRPGLVCMELPAVDADGSSR
ncbi:GNAT family N-acetyltransferase [Microbacterium sp. NPDC056052]|uniref:GNAT family N-acetyltransferase n=1 Tax=Microbacterium sp. NPDC056052 TaxID=3345695 RepID=UPI0035E01E8E